MPHKAPRLPFRRITLLYSRPFSTNPHPAPAPHQDPTPTPPLHSKVKISRSLPNSPILPLESVAVTPPLNQHVSSLIRQYKLTPRHIRFLSKPNDRLIAPETAFERRKPRLGNPQVRPPPPYSLLDAIAYTTVRAPATLSANVYVMAELQRRLHSFQPHTVLDFGAGVGVGVMALARVFSKTGNLPREAVLVEEATGMTQLVDGVLKQSGEDVKDVRIRLLPHLKQLDEKKAFDVVLASYSLNEIVRKALSLPSRVADEEPSDKKFSRDSRTRLAERRLKKTVLDLWKRVEHGGVLVVVEDGTAAGFEVVLFVRELILAMGDGNHVNIVAPCLHSNQCPLKGTVTPHRVCRFIQRYNRPPFLRQNRPLPDGFQDEIFSYIILQKVSPGHLAVSCDTPPLHVSDHKAGTVSEEQGQVTETLLQTGEPDVESRGWGRLLRAPLRRSRHIALDFCTSEGTLERRIVTKRNSGQVHFSHARRSKWGDVWTSRPTAKPHPVNF